MQLDLKRPYILAGESVIVPTRPDRRGLAFPCLGRSQLHHWTDLCRWWWSADRI